VDVLAARHNRVVVLTAAHVVYLKAEPARGKPGGGAAGAEADGAGAAGGAQQGQGGGEGGRGAMSYQLRWALACARVVHVRGSEGSLRVWLEYYKEVPRVRLTLRLNHQLRCANQTVYQNIVRRISRHVGLRAGGAAAAGGGEGCTPALGAPPGWQSAGNGEGGGEAGGGEGGADGGCRDLLIMAGSSDGGA
jgi:hypothetical protein